MAKLDYDSNLLQNVVKPNLTDSITNLNQSLGVLNYLNIPSDFLYKSNLESIRNELSSIKSSLEKTEIWLTKSISKINQSEFECNQSAISLPKEDLKERNVSF